MGPSPVGLLRVLTWLAAAAVAVPAVARAAAEPADVAVLVAPFETVAPAGEPLPDAAVLLADRLGTQGVGRVVGPSTLDIPALADPSAEQLRDWGERSRTDLVVTGRSTRIGRRISLDLRLRQAADGATVGTFVEEARRPEELGTAVGRLADRILAGAVATPAVSARGPARPEPGGSARDDAGEAGGGGGGGGGNAGQPLSVHSEEMEALQGDDGSRRFLFRRNVRLTQGEMSILSSQMEAFYPAGSNSPSRMVATGRVTLKQQGRRANCTRVIFYQQEQRLVCQGKPAELDQGTGIVRGDEIEFFLGTERLVVRGGADVFLEAAQGGRQGGGAAPAEGTAP